MTRTRLWLARTGGGRRYSQAVRSVGRQIRFAGGDGLIETGTGGNIAFSDYHTVGYIYMMVILTD